MVRYGGYWAMVLAFAWWVLAVGRCLRERWSEVFEWRKWIARWDFRQVALLITVLTLVAVFTVPRVYKVLFDEVVIQSTGWNLHMEREVGALNRGHVVDGLLRSLDVYLDKRPFFFPFLCSLVHDLTGYREANAFWLNTALFPLTLAGMYWLGRKFAGHPGGLAATVGLGAFSLFALNSAGAGLEMLNLALLVALMAAATRYLEKPDEARAGLLVLTAVLLANTRYESSIYVGCVALILLEGWRRAGRCVLPLAAMFAPLLLVPYALHNTYVSGTPFLWELREGASARFAFEFLEQNLRYAWKYFFNLGGMMANSPWLTFAGMVSAVVVGVWAWRRKPTWEEWTPSAAAVVAVSLGVVANLCLLMAYYWGDLSDPVVSRLSLPFHAVLALLTAAALGCVPETYRSKIGAAVLVGAWVCYVAFGLPVNQRLNELNTIETAHRWEVATLRERGPAIRLIVTDKSPLSWFALGIPAISPNRVHLRPEGLAFHLRHHTFEEVVVCQPLYPDPADTGGFLIPAEQALPANFVLEPFAERRVGGRLQRMSILREIREIEVDVKAANTVSSAAPVYTVQ